MEVERRLDSLAAGWSPPEASGGAGGLLSTQTLAEASVTKALRCTSSSSRIANDSNPATEKTPREWALRCYPPAPARRCCAGNPSPAAARSCAVVERQEIPLIVSSETMDPAPRRAVICCERQSAERYLRPARRPRRSPPVLASRASHRDRA
jgi:hypothetical protein